MKNILTLLTVGLMLNNLSAAFGDYKTKEIYKGEIVLKDQNGIDNLFDIQYLEYTPEFIIDERIISLDWDSMGLTNIEETIIKGYIWKTKEQILSLYDEKMKVTVASDITSDEAARKQATERDAYIKQFPVKYGNKIYVNVKGYKLCFAVSKCGPKDKETRSVEIFINEKNTWLATEGYLNDNVVIARFHQELNNKQFKVNKFLEWLNKNKK